MFESGATLKHLDMTQVKQKKVDFKYEESFLNTFLKTKDISMMMMKWASTCGDTPRGPGI